eukprot:8724012-Lingulodinium_polyedra.AAC.1
MLNCTGRLRWTARGRCGLPFWCHGPQPLSAVAHGRILSPVTRLSVCTMWGLGCSVTCPG